MALLDEHIDGKYEILEKLREGGMGAIYRVRHRLLDEIRVVKVIRSAVAGHPDAGERFLREARAAIRLRHPNIAVLHDFAIAEDGNAYIVMEMIDGWTLQEILGRQGPPLLPLTVEIARQSLRALGYLHRQKIVHRDVSPDNLMLTRDVDGRVLVKLIDLGIAKAFEESAAGLTSTGTFLGKPRYASPEQFGGGGLDARSDLYSFGIVLYELLTGRCPIHGNDPPSYMAGHLLRPPIDFAESDPGGRVPPALREIVLRSLAKKPEERFADAEAFAWALTLIQDELAPGTIDFDAVLRLPVLPDEVTPLPPLPGSTQGRLDREFLMTENPAAAAGGETMESMATRRISVPTSKLPELPEPTRPLSLRPDAPAPTIASPLVPVATQALPLRPAQASGPSVLDDLTWVTSASRRPEPVPDPPAAAPPAAAGAQAAHSPWPRIAAGAGVALLLAVGGGFWWRSSSTEAGPANMPEAGIIPPGEASAAVAPAPAPAVEEIVAPKNVLEDTGTEEFQLSTQAPAPVDPPQPEKKKVIPEEIPVPAADLAPMQRGDLIRRGMPNVEPPVPLDFPVYSYPDAARGSGRKANVRVGVLVDENGKVIEAVVRAGEKSGLGFNETALEAAWKAPFQPATRDDIPGRMWTDLIFEFAE